jgi:hypothetical protein
MDRTFLQGVLLSTLYENKTSSKEISTIWVCSGTLRKLTVLIGDGCQPSHEGAMSDL